MPTPALSTCCFVEILTRGQKCGISHTRGRCSAVIVQHDTLTHTHIYMHTNSLLYFLY